MSEQRNAQLTLNFSIESGVVTFDVEHGDGTNCEALAGVFLQDSEVLELGHKPEYSKAQSVGVGRRTT